MAYQYYLKKCGHQELGSVGTDGHPNRGRYLLIGMRPEILDFFPTLSSAQLNDFAPVACIPLFLENKPKVYCHFVYHNDKFHGSIARFPRNEYRLYLSKELEGGEYRLKTNDIVIFRKEKNNKKNSPLYMDLVSPNDTNNYTLCDQIIKDNSKSKKYAVYTGVLDFFESKIPSKEYSVVRIDQRVIDTVEKTDFGNIEDRLKKLFTKTMFRDFLLVGYEGLCAITRQVIQHNELMNIEAAHIRPHAHNGNYLPSNGLMLSRDLHWAFDKGFFTLTDDYSVLVHPEANSSFLNQFSGKKIFIPSDPFFQPKKENILWHRTYIYGHFKIISGDYQE